MHKEEGKRGEVRKKERKKERRKNVFHEVGIRVYAVLREEEEEEEEEGGGKRRHSPLVMLRRTRSFSQEAKEASRASVIFLLVPGVNGGTCAGISAT